MGGWVDGLMVDGGPDDGWMWWKGSRRRVWRRVKGSIGRVRRRSVGKKMNGLLEKGR
mgnify:FL=1